MQQDDELLCSEHKAFLTDIFPIAKFFPQAKLYLTMQFVLILHCSHQEMGKNPRDLLESRPSFSCGPYQGHEAFASTKEPLTPT